VISCKMPHEVEVRQVCLDVLGSLSFDDDTIDYIAQGVLDDDSLLSKDDLIDFVQPLLQEQCNDDEAKAAQIANDLHSALARKLGSAGEPAPVAVTAAVKQFDKPIDIGSAMKIDDSAAWSGYDVGGKGVRGYVAQESLKSGTGAVVAVKVEKQLKDAKANSVKRADRAKAEVAALDAEL